MLEKMRIFWLLIILVAGLTACSGGGAQVEGATTVRLMTHDSFDVSEEVLAAFETESGYTVEILKSGDGAEMVNKAILAGDNPLADVLFGVDNALLSRALDNDLFVPYDSPLLAELSDALKLDPENRALPVDYGDVCLNYDVAWFEANGLTPPQSLDDLAAPEYAGLTVVQNPTTSTPGLAFLLTTIGAYGEDGYLAYWESLLANDLLIVNGWEQAYYEHFSAASEGNRPIVVSYASSPPAEVFFAETPPERAPTAAVTGPNTCFRQIEFVGILRGSPNEMAARELVDFMLSRTFQEDMPLRMFVYPANETAELPPVFVAHSVIPEQAVTLDAARIEANREQWLREWAEVVLQ